MLHCTPFLLFDGNCAEAMTFYHQCFGGNLTLTKLAETPMKDQFPIEKHNRIINAQLKSNAINFSATDWMAAPKLDPVPGNMVSIFIVGETDEELKTIFDKLSVNADHDKRTFIALHQEPFGLYGQFTDQFAVSWIFKGDGKG